MRDLIVNECLRLTDDFLIRDCRPYMEPSEYNRLRSDLYSLVDESLLMHYKHLLRKKHLAQKRF